MRQGDFNWQPGCLQNETVILSAVQQKDFEVLYHVAADPEIWEQHPEQDRYKKEVFRNYFNSALASQSAFLIREKKSGKIIGSTRYYEFNASKSSIAIGYTFLAKQFWGGSTNKAVKQLLLDYAFKKVEKVFFHIGASNIRSQTAILKIDAKKVREYTITQNGNLENHFEYAIEKKDWHKG